MLPHTTTHYHILPRTTTNYDKLRQTTTNYHKPLQNHYKQQQNHPPQTTHHKPPTTNNLQPTTYHLPPTTYHLYLLPTTTTTTITALHQSITFVLPTVTSLHRAYGLPYSLSCGRQVPDVGIPHYRDARMQHSQSRQPALPGVTTTVAPRGVPASTNEVFPTSPTYRERRQNTENLATGQAQ